MRRGVLWLGLACLTVLGAVAACSGEGARPLARIEVGQPAPAYASTTLAGDSASLAALRGQPVLLNVWATWCHPCRTEIPELQALHERYAPRGLRVVGVSIDVGGEDAAVRDFVQEFGMTYDVWRDPDGRVSNLFSTIGVPDTYLIDGEGVIRWMHLGPIRTGDTTLVRAIEEAVEAR
jgi:DsbE subfamily thiol:disulfide oxidoreductase